MTRELLYRVWSKEDNDWCQVCKERKTGRFIEMAYRPDEKELYIRMCPTCVGKLAAEVDKD